MDCLLQFSEKVIIRQDDRKLDKLRFLLYTFWQDSYNENSKKTQKMLWKDEVIWKQ